MTPPLPINTNLIKHCTDYKYDTRNGIGGAFMLAFSGTPLRNTFFLIIIGDFVMTMYST